MSPTLCSRDGPASHPYWCHELHWLYSEDYHGKQNLTPRLLQAIETYLRGLPQATTTIPWNAMGNSGFVARVATGNQDFAASVAAGTNGKPLSRKCRNQLVLHTDIRT